MKTLFCGIIRDKEYRLNKWQVSCLDVPAPQPGPGSPCVLAATAWVPICCPRGAGPWARMRRSAACGVSTGLLGGLSLLQPLTRLPLPVFLPPPALPLDFGPGSVGSSCWPLLAQISSEDVTVPKMLSLCSLVACAARAFSG